MVMILSLMAAGILLGAFAVSRAWGDKTLRVAGHLQQAATTALLLFMGLWLGGNDEFWGNIRSIGLYGALFAMVCTAGSVAVVYLLTRRAFREGKDT